MTRSAPAWWRTIDPSSPATIELADELEQAIGRQLTLVRPAAADLNASGAWRSEDWTTAIPDADANAWLNANLPDWIASDPDLPSWPDSIRTLQARFMNGIIQVGVAIRRGERTLYLSASVRPHVDDAGALWLPATRVHIGRLPIPASIMLRHADESLEPLVPPELRDDASALVRLFRGIDPVPNPVIRLGDGRQVRLLRVVPRNRRLIVTCRTESALPPRADSDR
ncbi:MAG: hypothetical protein Kow0022_16340 [Phycisphaerales bacterium]